jgi:L-alanine-DL-glutamate epimerase-like enolase superfamily enzyme
MTGYGIEAGPLSRIGRTAVVCKWAQHRPHAMIEWRRFDLEAQLYGGVLAPQRGRIPVPQGPGLGIDPDPGVIRAYMRV